MDKCGDVCINAPGWIPLHLFSLLTSFTFFLCSLYCPLFPSFSHSFFLFKLQIYHFLLCFTPCYFFLSYASLFPRFPVCVCVSMCVCQLPTCPLLASSYLSTMWGKKHLFSHCGWLYVCVCVFVVGKICLEGGTQILDIIWYNYDQTCKNRRSGFIEIDLYSMECIWSQKWIKLSPYNTIKLISAQWPTSKGPCSSPWGLCLMTYTVLPVSWCWLWMLNQLKV